MPEPRFVGPLPKEKKLKALVINYPTIESLIEAASVARANREIARRTKVEDEVYLFCFDALGYPAGTSVKLPPNVVAIYRQEKKRARQEFQALFHLAARTGPSALKGYIQGLTDVIKNEKRSLSVIFEKANRQTDEVYEGLSKGLCAARIMQKIGLVATLLLFPVIIAEGAGALALRLGTAALAEGGAATGAAGATTAATQAGFAAFRAQLAAAIESTIAPHLAAVITTTEGAATFGSVVGTASGVAAGTAASLTVQVIENDKDFESAEIISVINQPQAQSDLANTMKTPAYRALATNLGKVLAPIAERHATTAFTKGMAQNLGRVGGIGVGIVFMVPRLYDIGNDIANLPDAGKRHHRRPVPAKGGR